MMDEDATSPADSVEIEEIANSMARDVCQLHFPDGNFHENSNSFKIPRVHPLVRHIDRFSYEPFVVSIGPYHHKNASLQFMEKLKWKCFDYILKLNCQKNIRDYILAVSDIENQARACYSDEIKLDSKRFRRMLLLDGCFILVFFNGIHGVKRVTKAAPAASSVSPDGNLPGIWPTTKHGNSKNFTADNAELKDDTVTVSKKKKDDTVVDVDERPSENEDSTSGSKNSVVQWYGIFALLDLFLLENQIPFFVVRKLHEVLVGSNMGTTLAKNISSHIEENLQYFTGAFGSYERPNDFCHLLHLCHMHFKPRIIQEESNHVQHQLGEHFLAKFCKFFNISYREKDEWNSSHNMQSNFLQDGQVTRWRRASQYHEAGIVFKKKEFLDGQKTHSLLDVTFHGGLLEIPCLSVDDRTGSLFRNMIAFEQTCPQFGNCVTAYVMFMSQLISSPDDVTLLSRRGIIVHVLHSDRVVSSLFTRLTKGVVFDFMGNFYLRSICEKMETYYKSRINRWIAWLRHNHLSNPWLGLALIAGLLVLFCTIAQTVLSVLAYVGKP